MATQNLSTGTAIRGWEGPFTGDQFTLSSTVDFAVNNGGSADVIQMVAIPAGTMVLSVAHLVVTAEGGTSTGTIGDGTDADGWIASVDNNATAATVLFSNGKHTLAEGAPNTITYTNALAAAGGKYYATADTIDMTLSANAVDLAKVTLIATCIDMNT